MGLIVSVPDHCLSFYFKSSEQFREEARILILKFKQINLLAFLLKYNETVGVGDTVTRICHHKCTRNMNSHI